jgi:dienelactone hydrolase
MVSRFCVTARWAGRRCVINAAIHAVVLITLVAPALADDPIAGLLRAPLPVPIVTAAGARVTLEGLVVRPDRPGRFPLVVMIQGTPRTQSGQLSATLAGVSPAQFTTAAVEFARRGYAAVTVLRRGFGKSDGPYAEDLPASSRCDSRDYLPIARISGEDVAAATAVLRREAWVDPERVLLFGQSTGGVAVSAAAAAGVPGVKGVLDFAGGRGSTAPDTVCNPAGLASMFGALGRTARVPALWIFAENDHFFGPDLARRMFAAYTGAGAPARLAMLPPFGRDGHTLVNAAPAEAWWPTVEPFLREIGLPTAVVVTLPPLAHLPPPSEISSTACQAGFAEFLAARTPARAFAVSPRGACGWITSGRTGEEAETRAIANCERFSAGAPCRVYAVGGTLATP